MIERRTNRVSEQEDRKKIIYKRDKENGVTCEGCKEIIEKR